MVMSLDWPIETEASRRWFERARNVSPGGVQGDGRFYEPYPLYIARAQGARLWDVDGNELIDYHASYGPSVLGHNDPRVRQAVLQTLEEEGLLFALAHPREVELAERIATLVPSAEKTIFTCAGTEATYHALRVARAATGRDKVLKFEGHYHGWHDYLAWSVRFDPKLAGDREALPDPVPMSAGMLPSVRDSVIVLQFNDPKPLEDMITQRGHEIAALFVEPINFSCGLIEAEPGFLKLCRDLCDRAGIVLVFDEIVSGFRMALGGAQELLGVTPDLTTMGKAVANGYPISLLTGRSDLMSHLAPEGRVAYSGTFNGQIMCVAAALRCTEILRSEPVHERLDALGKRLRDGIQEHIDLLKVKVQIRQRGSVWALYFTDKQIHNFRDIGQFAKDKKHPLQRAYQHWMLSRGIYVHPYFVVRAYISAAHTEDDVDKTVTATGEFLRAHRGDLL
jgi:glutamate-1-semialdehyde 2,1-aminomutase